MPEMDRTALAGPLHPDWTRLLRRSQAILCGLIAVLAVLVALVSYRYVLGLPPIPDNIAANAFRPVWLAAHAGFAATALLIGAVQFSGALRARKPAMHRWVGRVYVVSCLVGGAAGFVLAIGSSAGPIASAGFGGLAVVWIVTNVLGWQSALARQFVAHRRWMIRSWALTLSAVTLRLYIPIGEIAGVPEEAAFRAIAFLCWVPNLLIAELVLRRSSATPLVAGVHLCRRR